MSEETVAPADNAAAAPAAKPKLVMVLAIALAGIGSGGAAGAFVAGPMIAKKLVPPPAIHAESGKAEGKEGGEHGKGGEGKEGKDAEGGGSFLLDNLVLNPAGSGGGRYLLASISIRYASASMKEKFSAREAEIRDALLHVLGTKPTEQLADVTAREALKTEIKDAVDAIMGPKTVIGVFFPQFVIQ